MPIPSISVERDLIAPMRDGIRLSANLYKPKEEGPHPVIMSVTPYGKDSGLPERIANFFMRLSGVKFGKVHCSRLTGFESPDPVYWVEQGYAVLQADVRGMRKSEGHAGVLRQQDAEDYYDLIEWAASQPWCTGRVALMGVSYLCMSQWRAAALRPPHLCAIVPWEGVTDLYRELAFHGGIPETMFVSLWDKRRLRAGHNRKFPMAEHFLSERDSHPLADDYWAAKRPILEDIDVPALVCASWSDHGLHTRGSLEGYQQISSKQKWLFTHGRKKWETFYSEEALSYQRRFLDHFLKGASNGMCAVPRVRLELRMGFYQQEVRAEEAWPLQSIRPTPLYLCANTGSLEKEPVAAEGMVQYLSTRRNQKAIFSLRFQNQTELIGGMGLKLWISTSEGDDLDLFVVIRKLDCTGKEVFFSGFNGFERDSVAKGWLRASHRELDTSRSTQLRPWHTHRRIQKLAPGEIVPVDIEIWPSATLFESGSSLLLTIQGQDAARYPAFRHTDLVNRGWHKIFTGGLYDSCLTVPLHNAEAPIH
ncbi:MAG TPA: CocE/NonD family hydrolase [Candidatus Angelobacter sp.]|nr:CocE/NonD family hydrolase [Candidatus Angelobacter sp.]